LAYDNVCKFIAEAFPGDLVTWLLGETIEVTQLRPSELSLEPIRADSLILLESSNLVLHIEFQTQPDPQIPFRMTDYRLRTYRKFPEKEMHQVVIYLKSTGSPLVQVNSFTLSRTHHEFEVIRLWEQPTDLFLSAPGLLPFACLTETPDPADALNRVAEVIQSIPSTQTRNNLVGCTAILAGLVLEQDIINGILRGDAMRESSMYQYILQEGRQEGRQEGQQEKAEQIAINLLRSGMSPEQVANVTELSIERVQTLQADLNENSADN
jgi:predicted transposase/invertase (TIGR01784 family)